MIDKVMSLEKTVEIANRLRSQGRRLVFTNGCFELLHVGHIRYLQEARDLGDALVVGLNSDESVRAIKGPPRPLVPEAERAELLAALACVDVVVIFPEPTAEHLVATLKPDVYVKGGDYTLDTIPPDEAAAVREIGARAEFLPFVDGLSTTGLIRRIHAGSGGDSYPQLGHRSILQPPKSVHFWHAAAACSSSKSRPQNGHFIAGLPGR